MNTKTMSSTLLTFLTAALFAVPLMSFAAEDDLAFEKERAEGMLERIEFLVDARDDTTSEVPSEMADFMKDATDASSDEKAQKYYKKAVDAGYGYAHDIEQLAQLATEVNLIANETYNNYNIYSGKAVITIDDALVAIRSAEITDPDADLSEIEAKLDDALVWFYNSKYESAYNRAQDAKDAADKITAVGAKNNIEGAVASLDAAIQKASAGLDAERVAKQEEAKKEATEKAVLEAKLVELKQKVALLLQLLALKQATQGM